MSRAGPPGKESPALAANRAFRESKRSAGPYSAAELTANGNNLEPFSDPRIEAYLAFLTRELIFSDDPIELRAFLSANYAYDKFRRLGTPACRR